MIYIFAYRSLRRSLLRGASLAQNKPLVISVAGGLLLAVGAVLLAPIRNLLGIVPLHWYQWGVVFGGAVGLLGVVELAKFVFNRRGLHLPSVTEQT
jgi:magnesium-transporting ATPase (P-type)